MAARVDAWMARRRHHLAIVLMRVTVPAAVALLGLEVMIVVGRNWELLLAGTAIVMA